MNDSSMKNKVRYFVASFVIITLALAVMAYRSGSKTTVLLSSPRSTSLESNDAFANRWNALAKYYAAKVNPGYNSVKKSRFDTDKNQPKSTNFTYGPTGR